MARSELVSAAGKVFEFVKGIAQEVQDLGGSDEDLSRVLSEKRLRREIAELILGNHKREVESTFTVTVEYGKSVADLICEGGYNWSNPSITEKNFPSGEKGMKVVESRLIHFNRLISSDDAIRELDKFGLRPANVKELLAFGAIYKDEQRKYPIVALGSVWQYPLGGRYVPYLDECVGYRCLNLHWFERDWDEDYRFLAVSK